MSTLPKGWIETTLGDIANVVTDYVANGSFASLKENVTYKQEKDFARLIRLVDYNKNYKGDAIYVDENSYTFLKKSQLEPNDIIISNVGEYSGTVFRAPKLNIPMTLGPNAILVKFSNDDFMYYFLKSNIGQYLINTIKSGSANPKFNKTDFKKIKLTIPESPSEQKEIASILSSFDKKIELLKEQNQTLETMAQTIFKEWFVDFNYPNATDEMIDSEMGEIPKGWRVGKIGEIASLKSGYAFKSEEFVEESIYKVLKIKDLKGHGKVSLTNLNSINKNIIHNDRVKYFQLSEGDIVLAMSGNTTGKIGVIPNLDVPLYLNQRVGKFFLMHQKYKNFLYIFLMYNNYENKILSMGYGSAQPNISPSQIENIKLILPCENIYEIFTEIVNPLFEKLFNNLFQIQTLEETRDSLLPKLMSGQKRVFKYDN